MLCLKAVLLQATFEDELIEDARAKRHSLTCEAVEIGSKVRKQYIAMLGCVPDHHKVCCFVPMFCRSQHCIAWLNVFPLMQSKAYRTILTHFSQRYPKIPKIESSFLATTCIAFDLMSINLKGGNDCTCCVTSGLQGLAIESLHG